MGPCPVYDITFSSDGTATLHAEQNLKLTGDYKANLTDDQWAIIEKWISTEDYSDNTTKDIDKIVTDMPALSLNIKTPDSIRKMDFKGKKPKSILQLQREIEQLIDAIEWTKD